MNIVDKIQNILIKVFIFILIYDIIYAVRLAVQVLAAMSLCAVARTAILTAA